MRIVTTHDVFRGVVFGLPDPEQSIGPWFRTLVAEHATQLGHQVDRFSLIENGAPRRLLAAADREALPRDHRGWAWLFSDPEALGTVADLIAPLLEADLVVGFELPPNITCVLARAGPRFLDFGQDPNSFLLGFVSADPRKHSAFERKAGRVGNRRRVRSGRSRRTDPAPRPRGRFAGKRAVRQTNAD